MWWPVLGFGRKQGADRLKRRYRTGDWVVLVGTKSAPTREEDQGRLLGLVQVTNRIVEVEPLLRSLNTHLGPEAFVEDKFKWPYGFPFLRALAFKDKPLIDDLFPGRNRTKGRSEAAFAIEVSGPEGQIIAELNTIETDFILSPLLQNHKDFQDIILSQPGPPPAVGVRESYYEDGDNWVYIFRIAGTHFYKIGRANDVERRRHEFNSSPHAIWSGKMLEIEASHRFNDAKTAHTIEQMVHKHLERYRVNGECFIIPKEGRASAALAIMMYDYAHPAG